MSWEELPGRFALVGFEGPPGDAELGLLAGEPSQILREGGETTLLVPAPDLPELLRRRPEAHSEAPLALLRFRTPMGWEVVGFLALVASALADAGVPMGALCGFSRDTLFVGEEHLERARGALIGLFGPPSGPSRRP
jgi:hypothetical protein